MKKSETKISKEKLNNIIEELTNKGNTNASIGKILKDEHNIKNIKKEYNTTITKIQQDLKLKKELPDDLMNLIKKAVSLLEHQEENKKDMSAKRGYQLTVSKINRLRKYYIKEGKIPKTWRYSKDTAKLLVK